LEEVEKMAHEYSEEIKGLIYTEWLPRVMAGLLKGVTELPPEHREHVMMRMSRACGAMAVWALGIRPDMTFDELVKHLSELEPPMGPRTIEKVGDVVHSSYHCSVDENGKPICECPVVKLGMVEPFPELCSCGANMAAQYLETIGMGPIAKSELMGSASTTGEPFCKYVIYLKPSVFTTPASEG
jgi:hypothetical protein